MTGLSEGLSIKVSQGLTIVIAINLIALLFWFLQKTRMGKAMRPIRTTKTWRALTGQALMQQN